MTDREINRIDEITDRILASYRREPRTHRVDGVFMPSRPETVESLSLCKRVLFPGYYAQGELTAENIRYHVGGLLSSLRPRLTEQVFRCICYEHAAKPNDCCRLRPDACRNEAQRITDAFLDKLDGIRDLLNLDIEAAYDGDPAAKSLDEIIFCYPGFRAVMVYRISHAMHELAVPMIPRIMGEYAHSVTGVDIHPGATIGKRFFVDHGTGVVIGETTVIGDNVKVYQGVTLGARSFPKDERGRVIKGVKRHPTLCDNVTVYANATILGGETVIGKGVTIGGNTFVTESVSADHLVSTPLQRQDTRPKGRRGKKD